MTVMGPAMVELNLELQKHFLSGWDVLIWLDFTISSNIRERKIGSDSCLTSEELDQLFVLLFLLITLKPTKNVFVLKSTSLRHVTTQILRAHKGKRSTQAQPTAAVASSGSRTSMRSKAGKLLP